MKKFHTSALCILVLLTGCNIQKRLYVHGYYHEDGIFHPGKKVQHPSQCEKAGDVVLGILAKSVSQKQKSTKSTVQGQEIQKVHKEGTAPKFSSELKGDPSRKGCKSCEVLKDCDSLFLKNEAIILVKVVKITDNEIKYRYCNDNSGRIISIPKSEVLKLKQVNKNPEFFDVGETLVTPVTPDGPQKIIVKIGQPQKDIDGAELSNIEYRRIVHRANAGLTFGIIGLVILFLWLAAAVSVLLSLVPITVGGGLIGIFLLFFFNFGVIFSIIGRSLSKSALYSMVKYKIADGRANAELGNLFGTVGLVLFYLEIVAFLAGIFYFLVSLGIL